MAAGVHHQQAQAMETMFDRCREFQSQPNVSERL
jgi:hypothetical protein